MTEKKIGVSYPQYPKSLEESEALLVDGIRQFHASIVQARDSKRAVSIAIKAAAGLGKTSKVISELCAGQVKHQQEVHIEYYVPTHNLSSQLVTDIKTEYQRHTDRMTENERPSINVSILKGRMQTDEDGIPLCHKAEQVNALINLGYPVSSRLCRNGSDRCEHYTSCGYQKQFYAHKVDTKGITLPAVTVMTHQQLFLERHTFLPKPDFIVIDESFYQAGLEEITIGEGVINLITSEGEPSSVIQALREFVLDGKPLLKSFRDLNVSEEDILEEAKQHTFTGIVNIEPNQHKDEQDKYLKSAPKYLRFDYILTKVAEELETQQRDDSYILSVDRHKGTQLVFMKRKEMNLPDGVPILFIDADLKDEVIKAFTPNTKIINIPVERKATIHQFNRTLSNYSRKKSPEVSEQIKTFLNLFKNDAKALIVTTKMLRKEITGETDDQVKQTGLYGEASINHYSNLRGLNEFNDFTTVVIVDRNQPNNKQLERAAKALWFDTKTITNLGDTNYPMHRRGLRMKDHSEEVVSVSYHPDRHVQLLLEINREAEITQAIDRLRLLRGSHDRQVFIATSIPVDITVDYYWDWNLLQRVLKLLEICVVLPLHPEHFLRVFPNDTVKTKRGAQDLIKNLNNTLPLIVMPISDYVLFKYKHSESRKAAKALMPSSLNHPKEALERCIGVEVSSVERINKRTD